MVRRQRDGNKADAASFVRPCSGHVQIGRLRGIRPSTGGDRSAAAASCQSLAALTRVESCLPDGRVITYPILLFSNNDNAVAAPVLGRVGKTALQA
jgi:hypothetical protein